MRSPADEDERGRRRVKDGGRGKNPNLTASSSGAGRAACLGYLLYVVFFRGRDDGPGLVWVPLSHVQFRELFFHLYAYSTCM